MLRRPGYLPVRVDSQDESIELYDTLSPPFSRRVRISDTLTYYGSGSEASRQSLIKPPSPPPLPLTFLQPSRRQWIVLALEILAIFPFVALIVGAIILHNRQVEPSTWHNIELAVRVVVTVFPIVFAAIVGHLMRQLARLILQRATPLLALEQLMGSMTFFGTISTQWVLGTINVLGLATCTLWLLSPLGAQAALRVISADYKQLVSAVEVTYFDLNAYNGSTDISVWTNPNSIADRAFIASLLATSAAALSEYDPWGSFKLPAWRKPDGRLNLSAFQDLSSNATPTEIYPSLIGVPTFKLTTGRTNITVDTSYLDIECFNLRNVSFRSAGFTGGYEYFYYQEDMNSTALPNSNNTSSFQFAAYNHGGDIYGVSIADCSVRQRFVEAAVSCIAAADTQTRCTVTALHDNQKKAVPAPDIPPTLFSNADMIRAFNTSLVNSIPGRAPFRSTLIDRYLVDPGNLFADGTDNIANVFTLDESVLSRRLTQLVNSFYLSRLAVEVLNPQDNGLVPTPVHMRRTSGTNMQDSKVLTCRASWGWFAVLFVSTLAMIAAAIVTMSVISKTLIPDLLGYISTFTRDNPFLDVSLSSTLDGLQRTKALPGLVLRLGDGRAEDEGVGELAVGGVSNTARSNSRRFYR